MEIGHFIMPSKTSTYNQLWQAFRDAYPLKGHAWVDEEAGKARVFLKLKSNWAQAHCRFEMIVGCTHKFEALFSVKY